MNTESLYNKTLKNKREFLSMTSIHVEEFDYLLSFFRSLWYKFYRTHTTIGKRRVSVFNGFRKDTPTLCSVEDKLFFILVYMKMNPLQTFQAVSFGLSQSKVSAWINVLLPLLKTALGQCDCLPLRDGFKLEKCLSALREQVKSQAEQQAEQKGEKLSIKQIEELNKPLTINQDGMEQAINRKLDDKAQEEEYNGKKKTHTYKNQVNCTDNQLIVFFSHSYCGSVHDKKIADEEACTYPDKTRLRQDTGYQGYTVENVHIIQPFKKPKNKELTEQQKWYNTYVGQRRIVVEHCISGIKRCRIIKERCRLSYRKRDEFALAAAALHNFRVKSPMRAYKYHEKLEIPRASARVRA